MADKPKKSIFPLQLRFDHPRKKRGKNLYKKQLGGFRRTLRF